MRILYLIRRPSGTHRSTFRTEVLDFAGKALLPLAGTVTVAVSDLKPPALSVIPFRRDLVALVSLEGVKKGAAWPLPVSGFAGAYVSEVAFPVVHERTWPLGERSPGAGLFTTFRRKKGLEEGEFQKRWYEGHTPLTLEVHPNCGYVRNRVSHSCLEAGPAGEDWQGIVEEQYDPAKNLLSPVHFFGGNIFRMLPTMLRVYADVKGFIDYSSIHTWLTSEYRLK